MITIIKKHTVLLLSLLLAITGSVVQGCSVTAKDTDVINSNDILKSKINKLLKNKDWISISKFWKKLNKLESQASITEQFKSFESLNKELERAKLSLDSLKNADLLSEKEAVFLFDFLSARFHYLEFKMGTIKCYKMSLLGQKIAQTRGDLEDRYDIVEKLYVENKINSETFEMTKEKIVEDIKFIQENSGNQSEVKISSDLIDLIIYLNK